MVIMASGTLEASPRLSYLVAPATPQQEGYLTGRSLRLNCPPPVVGGLLIQVCVSQHRMCSAKQGRNSGNV